MFAAAPADVLDADGPWPPLAAGAVGPLPGLDGREQHDVGSVVSGIGKAKSGPRPTRALILQNRSAPRRSRSHGPARDATSNRSSFGSGCASGNSSADRLKRMAWPSKGRSACRPARWLDLHRPRRHQKTRDQRSKPGFRLGQVFRRSQYTVPHGLIPKAWPQADWHPGRRQMFKASSRSFGQKQRVPSKVHHLGPLRHQGRRVPLPTKDRHAADHHLKALRDSGIAQSASALCQAAGLVQLDNLTTSYLPF